MRQHRRPVSGAALAAELGISLCSLYRDIATLQGQGADISGEAGSGYVLRPGFLLPPLMFQEEEIGPLATAREMGQASCSMVTKLRSYTMVIRLIAALLFLCLGHSVSAQVVEEQFNLPVAIRHASAGEVRQEVVVTVFRDPRRPRSPFLVLGHGRAPKPEDRSGMGRARYTANSQYFVSLGFAVFVPTRIGYGVSGGPDLEDTGPCSVKNYPPGYDAAAQLTTQVIAHARRLPYVDPGRGLVVGQSFGGATAITMATRPTEGLVATINFAGGGGGRPATHPAQPCRPDMLRAMFADYGRSARIPTLWLYSENDRYFGSSQPRAWFDAFIAAGGRGRFVQLPANGDDGHSSFTRNPTAWRPHFEAFLQEVGFRN